MIFVTLGSQKFQFNRLLLELDRLIGENIIKDEVFAQIGYSDYIPLNFKYTKFMSREEYNYYLQSANFVITHGGTGAIIGALKKEKKVIAIARLEKYNEHVDDHQLQIIDQFNSLGFISKVDEITELEQKICEIGKSKFKHYQSNTHSIIENINRFLEQI